MLNRSELNHGETHRAQLNDLVVLRPEGLYCQAGGFYIDPWRSVDRAVITHAHADHARSGHVHYLATEASRGILNERLGPISLQTLAYGQRVLINGVKVSLHPAGHVLGSAQVRIEHRGEIWVLSGDYKLQPDPTCAAFEPVRCHTFVSESTFGLPIYQWQPSSVVFQCVNRWWQSNAAAGYNSVIFAYSFGKAQRILAGVDASIGPIIVYSAVDHLNKHYSRAGVHLPLTQRVSELSGQEKPKGALVVAPPAAQGSAWLKRFEPYSDAFASGWMLSRGARRRRGVDRGFVLSDHADWSELHTAISHTSCQRVIFTHGSVDVMVRYLQERGIYASAFSTVYGQESEA